jgi:AIR synthase related protein, N-terminal domain
MPDTSLENKDVAPKGQGQRKLDLKDKGSKHQESNDKESKDRGTKIGKIDLNTFQSFLLKRLGKEDRAVLVPPLTEVDAGVTDIGDGKVLIVAEDPIFAVPRQAWEMFGWYTVHIEASDIAVMGAKPRYMTYSLLMPPETMDEGGFQGHCRFLSQGHLRPGYGHSGRPPHRLLSGLFIPNHRRDNGQC